MAIEGIPASGGGGGSGVTLPITESDVTNLTTDLAAKAPLASPALTGTPTVPTAAQGTSTTQAASTAMVQSEVTLLAPKVSPTFTGTPSLPTGTTAVTQASTDSSTKVATTAMAQSIPGAAFHIGVHSYANMPLACATGSAVQTSANDWRFSRVTMAESGTLHDVSVLVNTTGGNAKIGVMDTGQANATHTTRTMLAISGSLAVGSLGSWLTYDPSLAVVKGDTLELGFTLDGTTAKVAGSSGGSTAVSLPSTNFLPSSGAGTSGQKAFTVVASANAPTAVNSTVTDGNMTINGNFMFLVVWRIT